MAEQVLLFGALWQLKDYKDEDFRTPDEVGLDLPRHPRLDYRWDDVEEALMQDCDHQMLFMMSLDGIEAGNDVLGIGDEMHPDHWFDKFLNV